MAEVVDAIIADLIVRNLDKYEADFSRATAVHDKFARSTDKLKAQTFDLAAEGQKYKAGTNAIGAAEEGLTQRVTRTRKARADSTVAAANRETAAVKKAAKEQADAAIAEAQRELATTTRIRNMVAQSTGSGGVKRGSGRIASTSVPGERTGQGAIPLSVLNGGGDAAAAASLAAVQKEINAGKVEEIQLEDSLKYLTGARKAEAAGLLDEMRLSRRLEAEGLADAQIALRLEERRAAVTTERVLAQKAGNKSMLAGDAEQFARGSGFYAATGGAAAVAGIATAAALAGIVAVTKEVVTQGLAYAETLKQESAALGISAHELQIWQVAAETAGVKTEQLKEGLGQLASNIGKAQEGSQQQSKIFKGLGIDLGNTKDGYKSLNDILPVFMDKLSKIPDQARRLAVETALGGEQLRKLDPILSKGSGSFDEMSRAIDATGTALSNHEIQRAAQTAEHLRQMNDQLQRQLAGSVSANAMAIDQLSTSFFRLAASIVTALAALQRFGARKVLESSFSSDADKASASDFLSSTPQGQAAMGRGISAGAKTLSTAGRKLGYGGKIFVENVGWVENTQQGRAGALATLKSQFQGLKGVRAADAAADANPAGGTGGPDLSKLLAGPGPKPKKGPKDQTDEREKRFIDEMNRLQDEQLRAQSDQTQDELARLEIKEKQLNTDTARQKADIESQVKQKQLTRAQADALEKQLHDTYSDQVSAIHRDKALEVGRRDLAKDEAILDAKSEALQAQESLARTAAERRDIELRLLELARQRETIEAQAIIDRAAQGDTSVSTVDLNAAKRTLKTQDKRFASKSATIDAQNRGPLGDYLAGLPNTVDQVNEAFQRAAVNGLQQFDDGLTSAVAKFLHLNGIAGQFLEALIKIGIERELLIPLANMLFPQQGASAGLGGAGGGFGSILSAIAGLFGGGGGGLGGINGTGVLMDTPGFATGVTGVFGGRHGTDNNILSLNGQPFARVNRGEPFAIGPNIGAANGRVNSTGPAPMVLQQTVNIDASGVNPEGYTAGLLGIVRRETGAAIQQSGRQVLDAVPGTLARAQTLKG